MEEGEHSNAHRLLPSDLDLQRAVLCSACTYRNFRTCETYFREHSTLGLTEVLLPKEPGTTHSIALAVAVDAGRRTLFVAFQGSKSLHDWLENFDITQISFEQELGLLRGCVEGMFHAGFSQRLQKMLPDMRRLKEFATNQNISRFVFCGHSRGGALAHMALVKLMINERLPNDCSHISIAFGSPHICNGAARNYLNAQFLTKRMFTYVKDGDPVPYLLNSMPRTRAVMWQYLGKRLYIWLRNCCSRGTVAAEVSKADQVRKFGTAALWKASLSVCHDCNMVGEYKAVGVYRRLGAGGSISEMVHEDIEIPLDDLTPETVQCHSIGAYVASFWIVTDIIGEPARLRRILPIIQSCEMEFTGRHEDTRHAKIKVTGRDLDLALACSVSGRGSKANKLEWNIERCWSSEIVLTLENEVDATTLAFLIDSGWEGGRAAFSVSVRTCFGKSKKIPVKVTDPCFESCMVCKMSRSIGKMFLMKMCGLQSDYSSAVEQLGFPVDFGVGDPATKISTMWKNVQPMLVELTKPMSTPENVSCNVKLKCVNAGRNYTTYGESVKHLLEYIRGRNEVEAGQEASFYETEIYEHFREKPEELEQGLVAADGEQGMPQPILETLHKRAKVIYRVLRANEELERVKTVMFLGPRFAGKSTLMHSVLETVVHDNKLPLPKVLGGEIAWFQLEDDNSRKVMMVEIPGGDPHELESWWNDLAHVADLCVLVLSFAGDTYEASKQWSLNARDLGLCNNVVMVVNGFDRVLHGPEHAEVWSRYSREVIRDHHRRLAQNAHLNMEDVFMAVGIPSSQQEPTTVNNLTARGVLERHQIASKLHECILKPQFSTPATQSLVARH